METVCKENMCAGCMACIDKCPKNAIQVYDSIQSYNAVIDSKLCIDCNACHKICQYNNNVEMSMPLVWYQGWASEQKIREKSSSGGIAAALAYAFIEHYGSVCSCTFQKGKFCFEFADSISEVKKFVGSKYVKSNPKGIYAQIRDRLKQGKKVLFIGLPCQVAAVKLFVEKKLMDNLYTVDLICHGSPSPKLLELFLNGYRSSLNSIKEIQFRKKSIFQVYNDYKEIIPERVRDAYTFAFLNGLDYTENCYSCKYATIKRTADITIGDSWGSNLDKFEQKKGISLILCQSDKGKDLIRTAKLHLEDVDLKKAIKRNQQLEKPSQKPDKRKVFLASIKEGYNFNKAIAKCYPKIFIKQKVKLVLIRLKILSDKK